MTTTFTSLPEGSTTTVKSGKGSYGQVQREAKTRWVLNPEAEGVPKVVVDLSTHHDPDSKVFRTSLTWGGVEPAVPGSPFHVETWASDHLMLTVRRTLVPRYSQKALEAEHAEALKVVKAEPLFGEGRVLAVFNEAAERNGLGAEVEA